MQREAEMHAAEDTKRREEVETRNTADTMAYTAEKTLRDNKDKIPSDLNKEAEDKIAAVSSALQGTDTDAIRRATQELNEAHAEDRRGCLPTAATATTTTTTGWTRPPGKEGGEGEGTVEGEFKEV